jgi:hypothetical protein
MLTLQLLGELAATPTPPVAPAVAVDVRVGQAGQWFGPTVVLFLSLALDWSALGNVAIRDRIAAAGYYAASLSMISIFDWSDDIQGWFGGSWSWQLLGSAVAAVMHIGLVLALLGQRLKWSAGMATWIGDRVHLMHKDSTANRINGVLLSWAVAAAASSVLARGDAASLTGLVARALTGAWSVLANWAIARLGG